MPLPEPPARRPPDAVSQTMHSFFTSDVAEEKAGTESGLLACAGPSSEAPS